MVLSHLSPKVWFATSYLRDKNLSFGSAWNFISSDSEFLTLLWQWWQSCLLIEHRAGRDSALSENMDTAKHCKVQSARKWDPCGTDLPVWLNQTRHPRWKRIHVLAKTLTSTLLLDSVYIWTKVNMKIMDRTFLIHTSLDEVQHPWVSKGRRWKELIESWVLGPMCRALSPYWGL